MKYTEELFWILDKNSVRRGDLEMQEKKYQENIDFVHSLGLKCDCVGWSKLDLSSPQALNILASIEQFCKENGWSARGYYTRKFAEPESEWFAIRFADAKDGFFSDRYEAKSAKGGTVEIVSVKAYKELTSSPKEWGEHKIVPERFRNACLYAGIDNIDFCWAQDKGKYTAEQYFHIYPHHAVDHIAKNYHFYYYTKGLGKFDFQQKDKMRDLGGSLPRLAEIFYELRIDLPNCYLASELPSGGFSSAYRAGTISERGEQNILVHKNTADVLIKQKVLSSSMLMPVPVLDQFPAGFDVLNVSRQPAPAKELRDSLLRDYKQLKFVPRPIRMISEKEALKLLRMAKRERKEDFQKVLPKAKVDEVAKTAYSPLIPFYLVSNGGYLSDEYEMLPYIQAVEKNTTFHKYLETEELLDSKPRGVVFAKCPDGDRILLCVDGTVIRFSHEAPEILEQWPSLAQFIVDTINE